MEALRVGIDDPMRADVILLLSEHLADMRATSPPDSVHALEPAALAAPGIVFLTARNERGRLLGCGALKALPAAEAEVKSMRTATAARGRGVATAVLAALLELAAQRGNHRVLLETGAQDFFAPARRFFTHHGFRPCPPFADYTDDPHSVYLALQLDAGQHSAGQHSAGQHSAGQHSVAE